MPTFTRTQAKALLDVLSKDEAREVMTELWIDKDVDGKTVLVATDGYIMAILPAPKMTEHIGKTITRESIDRWYKLAKRGDLLDDDYLASEVVDHGHSFSNWRDVTSAAKAPAATICVNPKFLLTFQQLSGEILPWVMHGERGYLEATNHDGSRYIVMPMIGGRR